MSQKAGSREGKKAGYFQKQASQHNWFEIQFMSCNMWQNQLRNNTVHSNLIVVVIFTMYNSQLENFI